jgi:hypothetical protein
LAHEEAKKICTDFENYVHKSVSLANKTVGLNPIIKTVRHCVHCAKGKERHRQFTYHVFPGFTGIETKMLPIILLVLIAKLTTVSGDCVIGPQDVNLNWNRVGIGVLTQLE